jgi:hypothetical protein
MAANRVQALRLSSALGRRAALRHTSDTWSSALLVLINDHLPAARLHVPFGLF